MITGLQITVVNFSWLISLPISRVRLIFFQYVFQSLTFVLILALLTSITLAWSIYHLGAQQTLAYIAQGVVRTRAIIQDSPLSSWSITNCASIITFLTWFSLAPLFALRRGKTGLQYRSASYSRKTQRQMMTYGVGTSIIFFLARSWLSWGFVWYCALNALAAYIGTQIAIHQLGLSPARKKLRAGIGSCLVGINMIVIVMIGQAHLKSGSADQVADVISFAGPYTGNADPVTIAHALEGDISPENVQALGRFYKNLLNEKKSLAPSGHPLAFRAAIQGKSSLKALIDTAELFNLNQVDFEDLKQFLLKAEKIRKTEDADYLVYKLMNHSFSEVELRELLESDSGILQLLAIRWVRFHPSNPSLTLIEERLDKYSDTNRLKALLTLSFGATKELHLKDYQSESRPKLNARYTPEDCKDFSSRDLKPSSENPLQKINLCLRVIALQSSYRGIHQQVDSIGWYNEEELKTRGNSLIRYLGLRD
jgi:hypothetical protein